MAEAYRKVGRGGAGNFYSKKDIEELNSTSQATGDLEAQKPAPADAPPSDPAEAPAAGPPATSGTSSSSSAPVYARTGRGGAGNFVDPLTASSGSVHPDAQPHPAAIVHSTGNQSLAQAPAPPRLSGRGGAGNFAGGGEQRIIDGGEQERKRKEAIDNDIFADVRAGLREPGRAHTRVHPHGRGGGPNGLEES